MAITINGQIKDQFGSPVVGMTVRLREGSPTGIVRDTDVTDGSGNYSVTYGASSGTYYADPAALSPHYSDPGVGSGWFAPQTVNGENFTSTFSNSAPTRGTVGNQSYERDSGSPTVDRSMADTDGDTLTPVKDSGPAWATLSKVASGTYRWTFNTTGVVAGDYPCSYHIEDGFGGSSSTENFTVTITEPNDPPDITNPGTLQYQNNSGVQQEQLVATDPDEPLTYSKTAGEGWGSIHPTTGIMSFDTDAAARGTNFGFIWRVQDALGAWAEVTHGVQILNNPPVLTNPGTKAFERATGDQQFQLASSDADGDTPSYSKVSGPAWATVVSSTGLVTVDTDLAPEGTHSVTWRVSDGQGGQDDETHNIVIGATDDAGFYQVIG